VYSHVAANKRKTVLLILVFMVLIGSLGWVFAEVQGTYAIFVGVLIFAVVYAFIGYYASAKIALALSGAKPIEKKDAPRLYRIVENLSITAGLPMPKVYMINDLAPNAFATGRDPKNAAVAATTGILDLLDDKELEGVMAHEMSHVGNYDIRVMGVVLVLVTVIALLSDIFMRMMWFGGGRRNDRGGGGGALVLVGILAAVIAPLIATLLKLAVSRKREYLADASGALLTRYPEGLASALEKIGSYSSPMRHASSATAHLFFANPLKNKQGKEGGFAHLFSTHPPIAERVKRLQDMGGKL
jgi:heat shock protein HtpX